MQTRCDHPTGTIAVLVRNRSHLNAIVQHIKEAGLRFRAIDIELLSRKPVVQDLLILTRALINPADRLAWVALLRAPWCGLLLKDIAALAGLEQKNNDCTVKSKELTVWELLCDESHWHAISTDAMARIRRVRETLKPCMDFRQRQSLRLTVEAAWQALGGPGCLNAITEDSELSTNDLDDAMIFLDYLENQEEAGDIQDLVGFERRLNALYASSDLNADDSLQVMTIHKAKGLEFDTVIVPGLGRGSRNNDKQLLKWTEQPHSEAMDGRDVAATDLLLAPIQETGTKNDAIYMWMEKLDREKGQFESDRLLYVAATRARKFLHLLGHVNPASDTDGKITAAKPLARSLLQRLWPIVQSIYSDAAEQNAAFGNCQLEDIDSDVSIKIINNQGICRLRSDWRLPDAPSSVIWQQLHGNKQMQEEIEFSWVSEMARHAGQVVHRWLQQIAQDEMVGWNIARIKMMRGQFKQNLFANGMSGNRKETEDAVTRIIQALINAISDNRGQWILGPQLLAQNELKISGSIGNVSMNWRIDRTFCDSNGIRWIIDYKTSSHEGSDSEGFLDREQIRYQHQLNRYAKLMQQMDPRPIRIGIYFPLICGWREWKN
jgi:ATP-dependent exoDNAse (exonuclease V) beta subunit